MGKCIIQAVAGAGKTTNIVNRLNLIDRFLIVTYTTNNTEHLRLSIIKKFGYFPSNITLYSYFHFLISVCYKPFLSDQMCAFGISWKTPPEYTLRMKRSNLYFYLSKKKYLYYNRIAKLCQDTYITNISNRINKYYDYFFFDEIQDLAGHDFNLIKSISPQNTNLLFLGDFYQHTFDTSRDGIINVNLHKEMHKYFDLWRKENFIIDTISLQQSYRCSKTVCDFVRIKIGIHICAINERESIVEYITSAERIDAIVKDNNIIKLFFNNSDKYNCWSLNWGNSKGLDHFTDVCVILNKTTNIKYNSNQLQELAPSTRNKLYVACTRARGNLYLIPQDLLNDYRIIP